MCGIAFTFTLVCMTYTVDNHTSHWLCYCRGNESICTHKKSLRKSLVRTGLWDVYVKIKDVLRVYGKVHNRTTQTNAHRQAETRRGGIRRRWTISMNSNASVKRIGPVSSKLTQQRLEDSSRCEQRRNAANCTTGKRGMQTRRCTQRFSWS